MNNDVQDYRVTSAYNAVLEFVAQMHHDSRSGPMAEMGAAPDPEDLSEDDDDPSGRFTRELTKQKAFSEMIEEAREVIGYASSRLPYIQALCHSADDEGFLVDPVEVVADEYSQALGTTLDLEILEDTRVKLRDGGPVLGMLSLNPREYRYAILKHLNDKKTGEAACVEYSWQLHNATREIKALETEGLCLSTLCKLAKELYYSTKKARRLTAGMVKKLVTCDGAQAEMLHQAYELLPLAPRG